MRQRPARVQKCSIFYIPNFHILIRIFFKIVLVHLKRYTSLNMPKRTKKRRFTPVKKKSPNGKAVEEFPNQKLPFAVGDEVLACWQDGLYYLAFVKTVCVVMFVLYLFYLPRLIFVFNLYCMCLK